MHKLLPLFALMALRSPLLVQSAPELRIPAYTMAEFKNCQALGNPKPEDVLLCRKVIHRCCLERRKSSSFDNCMSCVPEGPTYITENDSYRTSWGRGCQTRTHNRKCIPKWRKQY